MALTFFSKMVRYARATDEMALIFFSKMVRYARANAPYKATRLRVIARLLLSPYQEKIELIIPRHEHQQCV
jgi:hypothetical protein